MTVNWLKNKIMFDINYQEKAQEIQEWIAETVVSAGFKDVVVAVSGGVDSAVSLNLSVGALGKEHVYALLLPHGDLSQKSLEDGKLVAESAGLSEDHIFLRNIKDSVNVILNEVKDLDSTSLPQNDSSLFNIRQGNMMARVRMIYVFDLAKEKNALVVGTENKTEHYLGYFTRFGDEASDIEPIRSLYKTQVWEMAKHLGVPSKIIEKAPSAGLWENQSDEVEFGFTYKDADKVLSLAFDEGMRNGDIVKAGIDEKVVRNVLEFVDKNSFKRHVPYVKE